MLKRTVAAIAIKSFAVLIALTAQQALAQGAAKGTTGATTSATSAKYSKMAPLEQYLMADRNAEIALARTAAPTSISADAEVLVLARHGYETAVKGKNGFVCIVGRGWAAAADP